MNDTLTWKIIDVFFKDNPKYMVSHHIDSFNSFFNEGIKQIIKEKNPLYLDFSDYNVKCEIWIGGIDSSKIFYSKPAIYDSDRTHFMFPNEARLRNMTYGSTIHYDVDLLIKTIEGELISKHSIPKILLGRFPIMLQSSACVLYGLNKHIRFQMGECRNDMGGYFIIDGSEKGIICQEKFADNMIYVRDSGNDIYSHSVEIRSVSEDASKPIRTISLKITSPTSKQSNGYISAIIPNVRLPIPLFILMRALGVESDKDIIKYCLLDLDTNSRFIELFRPSIHDAGTIFDQSTAIKYIGRLTKGKTDHHSIEILTNYLLPHVGEMNFTNKALFIGFMVKSLLDVFIGEQKATDRDSFTFKRIELSGILLYDLFRECYFKHQHEIVKGFDNVYYYAHKNGEKYTDNAENIIFNNLKLFTEFKNKKELIENRFLKAFKGDWGTTSHTKRIGVVQDIPRLSFNSFISFLRKINLPFDSSSKIIKPRLAHTTHWGVIDPVDTPDGGHCGLHKSLAIIAGITTGFSPLAIIEWLRLNTELKTLPECSIYIISKSIKLFVNGNWIGMISNPNKLVNLFKFHRRHSLIPQHTSIRWDIPKNIIFIYTDSGRLYRPIFYVHNGIPSYSNIDEETTLSWHSLVCGNEKMIDKEFSITNHKIYSPNALYGKTELTQYKCSNIDLVDTSEFDGALIAMDYSQITVPELKYTHIEIHPSLVMGVIGSQLIFPEHNQCVRDVFGCGQTKQTASLYHTNYNVRVDKTGIILNNGQVPVVKTRYLNYINNEEHSCGENAIVAIMSLNGYNVEDSILFNEASIQRGMFRTTYFSVYEGEEESSEVNKSNDTVFSDMKNNKITKFKPGNNYSKLNQFGLIDENQTVDENTILIGMINKDLDTDKYNDVSICPKKGQVGVVDKSYMTDGKDGFRIAKVKIRSERSPDIGDKFASRHGQKGTVGLIIPERDMPFTSSGIKPDLIINPHAIPSRMTIGQLIETIVAKSCVSLGYSGDGTAFVNKSNIVNSFGKILTTCGFHSSGNEILYNGQTGEQIESAIFIGPTYYMRLKHMVKDKINYRARGPMTMLTRQPVQGRANDGGLRIGEMERDGLIAHGVNAFIRESMLVRGDDYYIAICNKSGTIAIYNESCNMFLSPFMDGPIKFNGMTVDNLKLESMSTFGKTFSIIRIPYAFKLFMQELTTMNVQMRIITEDNVDQLTNVLFAGAEATFRPNLNNEIIDNEQTSHFSIKKYDNPSKSIITAEPDILDFEPYVINVYAKNKVTNKLDKLLINVSDLIRIKPVTILLTSNEGRWSIIKDSVNKLFENIDKVIINADIDVFSDINIKLQNMGFVEASRETVILYEIIGRMKMFQYKLINFPKINAMCSKAASIAVTQHFNQSVHNASRIATSRAQRGLNIVELNVSPELSSEAFVLDVNGILGKYPDKLHVYICDTTDYKDINGNTSLYEYYRLIYGLLTLQVGGTMIAKLNIFYTPFLRSLIALISTQFDNTFLVIPHSIVPLEQCVYMHAQGYKGINSDFRDILVYNLEVYIKLKINPELNGSLINTDKLILIDDRLYEILKKYIHVYVKTITRLSLLDKQTSDEKLGIKNKTQSEWMTHNGIGVVSINRSHADALHLTTADVSTDIEDTEELEREQSRLFAMQMRDLRKSEHIAPSSDLQNANSSILFNVETQSEDQTDEPNNENLVKKVVI